jgi:hypothetical protein
VAPPPPPVEPPAEPPPAEHAEKRAEMRTLKGHTFVTPFLVDSAFNQRSVGLSLETGRQWNYGVIPSYPSCPAMSMLSPSCSWQFDQATSTAAQVYSFGWALGERIELGASVSYRTLLSSDVSSLLYFGGQSSWGVQPAVRIRLVRSPQSGTQLALRLYGNFGGDNQQSPAALLAEIAAEANTIAGDMNRTQCLGSLQIGCALNKGFDAQAAASTRRTLYGAGVSLNLAQAFNSLFGFQASLSLEPGYRTTTVAAGLNSIPFTFHVGVAPSLYFGPKVPLTLAAEYLLTVSGEPPSSTAAQGGADGTVVTIQSGVVGGLYYTYHQDFTLGLLFSGTFYTQSINYSDPTIPTAVLPPETALAFQTSARYFF